MRAFNAIIVWLMALTIGFTMASCDPMSSVEYKIYNVTSDTVTVTFHKEIMTSPYQGYELEENDSVTTHYTSDTSTVAIVAPSRHLTIRREWHGLYREELIVPAWKYIVSIKVGKNEIPPERWNNESAWRLKTRGGGFGEDESRYYDLLLKQ